MRLQTLIPCLVLFAIAPVAAQQNCPPGNPSIAPDARYELAEPGPAGETVVIDTQTGLVWKQCREGQSGPDCSGTASTRTWTQALTDANNSLFAGHDDWRLPSVNELQSLLETGCASPAINLTIFPDPVSTTDALWSSTTYAADPLNIPGLLGRSAGGAWSVGFDVGDINPDLKSASYAVRLVRGGQGLDTFASELDATPDPFDLVDQTGVPTLDPRTSAPVTVAALTTVTGIGVSGATGSTYSINSEDEADFTAAPGAVRNGDVIRVRHTSAATPFTMVTTTLTIGGVSEDFTTTTGKAEQAALVATASPATLAYGGTSTLGTTGGSGTGAVSYAVTDGTAYCAVNGTTLTGTSVGTCTVTATKAADDNYFEATTTVDVDVSPLAITVTADAQSKVYGAADPALTYSASPALINGDGLTGALDRISGEDVGSYAIGQGTLAAGNNYTLSYVGADLTIAPLAITVTADAKTKVYGAADPALSYSASPALINGDSFAGSLSRAPGENVGNYAIGQGTLAAGNNYALSYVGADLTITPLAITVTADAQSKTYGEADPALTYTVAPTLIDGDSFSGNLSREPGEDVGVYTILPGDLSAGGNYTLSFQSADFSIEQAEQAALTVIANPASVLFGETSELSTTGGSGSGEVTYTIVAGETVCEVQDDELTGIGLGSCAVQASKAGDGNYLPATATTMVSVTAKADLEIAKDADRMTALIGDTVVYSIVVGNTGPNDVAWANLRDVPPASLVDVEWACVPAQSTTPCPAPPDDAGIGSLNVLLNLPANTFLRYDLSATVQGVTGAVVENTASITASPGLVTDPDTTNNSARASILIVPQGIFADGFEPESGQLRVPGAEQARERQRR